MSAPLLTAAARGRGGDAGVEDSFTQCAVDGVVMAPAALEVSHPSLFYGDACDDVVWDVRTTVQTT
jgi:hypothetical protein